MAGIRWRGGVGIMSYQHVRTRETLDQLRHTLYQFPPSGSKYIFSKDGCGSGIALGSGTVL